MVQAVEHLLGTRAEVSVTDSSQQALKKAEVAVLEEAARLEQVFSVFNPASELHTFRRTGKTQSPELQEVLALAHAWQERTSGAFHCGVQPLFDLWNAADAADTLPSRQELAETVTALHTTDHAIVNLNAVAKGWIAERAVLSQSSSLPEGSTAWLNLGGDIIHYGTESLQVGIENPHRPFDNEPPLATIAVNNEAVATSGGSRRWWTIDSVRYPQVLDPRTGQPVNHMASATVLASDAATADVLATVASIVPIAETLALVEEAHAHCLLVSSEGTVTTSSDRFLL